MKKLLIAISAIALFSAIAYAELIKETTIDKMEVLENGTIQVRQAIRILEDGKVISQKFHRYVVTPGQDVSDKDQKVQDLAASVWTQAVIDAYAQQQGQELTLDQQKAIKTRLAKSNIKSFVNARYDDDLKLGLLNALMEYAVAGQTPPTKLTQAKTWLQTVQGLYVAKAAAIQAAETEEALDAIDVSTATLEAQYGDSGTVLADPDLTTADLVAQ